jgi:cell division septation protein DedD
MKNREFREIQVSSTQLAIIFLGILIIGVVIFLLGVSVGKKHAQVADSANVLAQKEPEQIKEKITTLPQMKPEDETVGEPAGKPTVAEPPATPAKREIIPKTSAQTPPAKSETKTAPQLGQKRPVEQKNLYYVQVAALAEQSAAQTSAQKFRGMGYSVLVMNPQPSDRTPVYRVRVGGFSTREQAEEVRTKLSSAAGGKTDYFIVRD